MRKIMSKEILANDTDLSELLEVTLDSIESTLNSGKYAYRHSVWHNPVGPEITEISAAGAVMAHVLKSDFNAKLFPKDFDSETEKKLQAINCLINFDFWGALTKLGIAEQSDHDDCRLRGGIESLNSHDQNDIDYKFSMQPVHFLDEYRFLIENLKYEEAAGNL